MAGPLLLPAVSAFNLELKIAIIKQSQPSSNFQYSLVQHQILL